MIGHLREPPLPAFYAATAFPLSVEPSDQSYNACMKTLYLHGWHSVPGGVKPTFLAQHGHEVLNPALSDEDFTEAVRIAQGESDKHRPDVIVG